MADKPERRKSVVVSGYYGYRNLGDDAILDMLCRDLSEDCDLTVLSRRPEETSRIFGVKAVHRFRLFKVLNAVKHADLLISGGGSLLQDKTSTRSLLYYLLIIRLGTRYATPTMIYANGIGPILGKANRKRTAKVLRNADRITLRDEDSAGIVQSLCPGKEVTVTADPVFRMSTAPEEAANRILRENGISGKDVFAVFLRSTKNTNNARLAALFDEISARTGCMPVFIAMQEPGDRKAALAVRRSMKSPSCIIREPLTGPELIAVLRRMRGAVSMRLHALIFGAVAGIPLVGFDEDPKIKTLLGSLDPGLPVLPKDIDPAAGAARAAEWMQPGPARDLTVDRKAGGRNLSGNNECSDAGDLSGKCIPGLWELYEERARGLLDPGMVRGLLYPKKSRFVLHIISGGDTGGAKTHVLSLLKGVMEKGIRILLVCFLEGAFSQDARTAGIPVRVLPKNDVTANFRYLTRFVRRHHVDIVHSHGAKGNMYGVMLQRKLKVPVITTVHSDPSLDYLGRPAADRVYGAINRRAIRSISWHECVSEELRETLVLSGVRRESTFLIHNSAAAEAGQIPVSRSEWRRMRNLGTDENTVVFGTAARFSPVKDISTLISAFSEAVKNAPDARLVIAGDGEEDAKLKLLAAKLCPPGTVIFTGWLEDTASFYNAIDVNVLTSLTEGFPYAIPEGGIMECATIATLVGSIPQILTDGEEGLLFEPGDVGALSRHMEVLIKDPALRERLGRAICLKIRSEYSFDSMIRRQLEIYDAVLSS